MSEKKSKKEREAKKAHKLDKQNTLMTQEERRTVVHETTIQLLGLEDPSPGLKWANMESIKKMRAMGFDLVPGDFAENLTTEGLDLVVLPIGSRLAVGEEVILEVTQIGKECHAGCAIFKQVGKCIMPKEGIFAKVIRGGKVKQGDSIHVVESSMVN